MAIAPIQALLGIGTFSSLSKAYSEAGLNVSEEWLLLFGFIVAVGVVGELLEERESKKLLNRRVIRLFNEQENLRPSVHVTIWKKYKRLFSSLVLIGVAGEFFCDGGVWLFSDQLQTISDRDNAALQGVAYEAEREAQSFRLKADELETEVLPRTLAFKQYTNVMASLQSFQAERLHDTTNDWPKMPTRNRVIVEVDKTDIEAVRFSMQIEALLYSCGFAAEIALLK